ncbi:MAG: tetratricopeptide repeat protein [Verrucomicrobiota bacterium]|nr:tetratricopeptide repeat protein [Verrucomicrobiota bacterium]MDQ6939015.1 tetratricopeptide repeat protein [Verrucomicrobiota bacterium]
MKVTERTVVPAICLAIAALIWFVFGQTLQHDFINLDDPEYVLKNPHVAAGLTSSGIVWAFSHTHAANWHPLTWIAHMLDCQFYGLVPRGHHLTNVVLHAATAILLFLVLWRMTAALWRSAFVSAVFAIHPLRVESVAWIAERKDVLSAFFFVLTIGAYARYTSRPSRSRYALVLVLFALGLMSKPMLVSVPFVLLLLDYWPLRRWPNESKRGHGNLLRKLLLEKIPFLALAAGSAIITIIAQQGTIQSIGYVPIFMRISNAAAACLIYLRQLFWPSDLAAFYPLLPKTNAIAIATTLLALGLFVVISLACIRATRQRYLLTGWFWFLLMLAPVIGIIQVGVQSHADRYTYLPQIGLYLLLTWATADFLARWRLHRIFASTVAAAIIASLALGARTQASYWKDSETLWKMTAARTPPNTVTHLDLGEAFYEKGKLGEAIEQYELALQGQAMRAQVHSALGLALLEAGEPQQSIAHLEAALAIAPNFAEAHYNLGNSFLQTGQNEKAIEQYDKALELDSQDIEAQNNLAWLLATSPESRIRDGRRAVELAERADTITAGKNPIVAATLAAAYAESGRFAEAIKTAQRAIELSESQGNPARARSIRIQLESYQAGSAFRDQR